MSTLAGEVCDSMETKERVVGVREEHTGNWAWTAPAANHPRYPFPPHPPPPPPHLVPLTAAHSGCRLNRTNALAAEV
jgi:hypothetical protein